MTAQPPASSDDILQGILAERGGAASMSAENYALSVAYARALVLVANGAEDASVSTVSSLAALLPPKRPGRVVDLERFNARQFAQYHKLTCIGVGEIAPPPEKRVRLTLRMREAALLAKMLDDAASRGGRLSEAEASEARTHLHLLFGGRLDVTVRQLLDVAAIVAPPAPMPDLDPVAVLDPVPESALPVSIARLLDGDNSWGRT